MTHAGAYVNRSSFLRVDRDRQLPDEVQREVVRRLLGILAGQVLPSGNTLATTCLDGRRELRTPGWGAGFVYRAFAAVIGAGRHPGLDRVLESFVDGNVVRSEIQGRRPRRRHSVMRTLRYEAGDHLAECGPSAGAASDLIELVRDVPGLSPPQRGELYLRLVLSLVGATGAALEWAMIFAARDGAALTRARARAVILEAERLWPPGWMIAREAAHDHVVDGQQVRAGQSIFVMSYLVHRAADVWGRAEEFCPDRWEGHRPDPGAFIPFAAGSSACPARGFAASALLESVLALTGRYVAEFRRDEGSEPRAGSLLVPFRGTLGLTER